MSTSPSHAGELLAADASPPLDRRHREPALRGRREVSGRIKEELRTPMASLQALRQTIEGDQLDPELARRMRRHARLLARSVALLIEDLVLVHTAGPGHPVLNVEDLVLADQVARAAELFPALLIRHEAIPQVRVHADALRLQQLLANLLRGTRNTDGAPMVFDAISTDRMVTLRLTSVVVSDRYELDIVRLLARAHGGAVHGSPGDRWVGVTLPRADATS